MSTAELTMQDKTNPLSFLFRKNLPTFLLTASMFLTGACGLVSEYVLSTVSTYILGNSIEQWSMIIASMMLAMSASGAAQRWMSDKHLIEKFVYVEVLMALLGGFAPIALYFLFNTMPDTFIGYQFFFVLSIGALIGLEIPIVMRINELYEKQLKANLAYVFTADYLGAFVGAFLWVKVLLKNFPITEISFIIAVANFSVAVITFIFFMKKGIVKRVRSTSVLVLLTAVALIVGFLNNRGWSLTLEQKMYDDPIIFAQTTRYQRIVVTHYKALDDYRLYINGNIQLSTYDEYIYHEHLVHPIMSMAPSRKNVLILGGGDGFALHRVLQYPDVENVTLVDLDPDMIRLFATDPTLIKLNGNPYANAKVKAFGSCGITTIDTLGKQPLWQHTGKYDKSGHEITEQVAAVNIFNVDADKFVGEINGRYDAIIIDFPDPNSIELSKLYSKEFYLKLSHILSENGMFVVQSTNPDLAKEAYLCILRTINAAGFHTLPYHDYLPSFGEWGWIMGWKNSLPDRYVKSAVENIHIPVETKYLTPEVFQASTVFGKNGLKSKSQEINTLMYPCLVNLYIDESWKYD